MCPPIRVTVSTAAIYRQTALAGSWIFKGGTCLKKCYFETCRFSEDLDFTLTGASQVDHDFLADIFRDVGEWIYEQIGIELPEELREFEIFESPRGTVSGQGKLSYRGPIAPRSGGLPRIKLDLTPDELLVLSPVERAIVHEYSDAPAGGIAVLCYACEEVFAEKVRALGDRARPRDLYDVINLYRNAEARPRAAVLLAVLQKKCKHRTLAVPSLRALETHRGNLEGSWQPMLGHQLQALPLSKVSGMPEFFAWLQRGVTPAEPATSRLASRAKPCSGSVACAFRFRAGSSRIWHPVPASNRLCVDLEYQALCSADRALLAAPGPGRRVPCGTSRRVGIGARVDRPGRSSDPA